LAGLWRLVVANRSFVRFELRGFMYTASIGLALPILPLFYVHEVAASDAWIGIIGGAGSAGSVLGYLVARQVARRRGPTLTLLPSMLVAAAAPAVLSFIGWLPAVAGIAFIAGIAGAGAQLALFDQLMRRIPTEQGVTFSSVDQSLSNLAIVIGPNVGGVLATVLGIREALVITAAVGFVAFVLFGLDIRGSQRRARARAAAESSAAQAA
jgi:MFS family permease